MNFFVTGQDVITWDSAKIWLDCSRLVETVFGLTWVGRVTLGVRKDADSIVLLVRTSLGYSWLGFPRVYTKTRRQLPVAVLSSLSVESFEGSGDLYGHLRELMQQPARTDRPPRGAIGHPTHGGTGGHRRCAAACSGCTSFWRGGSICWCHDPQALIYNRATPTASAPPGPSRRGATARMIKNSDT